MFPVIVDTRFLAKSRAIAYEYSVRQRPKIAGVWRAILIASTLFVAPAQAADLPAVPYFPASAPEQAEPAAVTYLPTPAPEKAKPTAVPYFPAPAPVKAEAVIDYKMICRDIILGKPVHSEYYFIDCDEYLPVPVMAELPAYNPASPN